MQKIIYTCDRCGKKYDGRNECRSRHIYRVYKIVPSIIRLFCDENIQLDLCDECIEELDKWMKNET